MDERLRILITHHAPDQLDRSVRGLFDTEIAPPGRFHLHLCGGAHDLGETRIHPKQHGLVIHGLERDGYLAGKVDFDHLENSVLIERRRDAGGRWTSRETPLPLDLPQKSAPAVQRSEGPPVTVERIVLENFRLFHRLELDLRHTSRLPGNWTCIAGINGAGKSSIVQAIALAVLGDELGRELGGKWLDRCRRIDNASKYDAKIEVVFRDPGGRERVTRLDIMSDGSLWSPPESKSFGGELRNRVCLAYGATRNLSPSAELHTSTKSDDVRSMMTVFDPLARLANAESVLRLTSAPLFQSLIRQVFDKEVEVAERTSGIQFRVGGREVVEAVDLPDGFRTSAAWLADLCAAWMKKRPELASRPDPALIEAIVVIDEVDLHLHPSLQRSLVPRLRAALPRVQWIVTTHSPLVLANFDSSEIIALDRSAEGGIRKLDRQIMGFTTDQIYEWLMGTEPTGAALENQVDAPESDDSEIAEMLLMSPRSNAEDAKQRYQKLRSRLSGTKP
ncbi:MAG: hypothetical protein FJW39_03445 [Acidobacteria bacterium]|nr:hypothetical protein [Acidobacteriota bacterium]